MLFLSPKDERPVTVRGTNMEVEHGPLEDMFHLQTGCF